MQSSSIDRPAADSPERPSTAALAVSSWCIAAVPSRSTPKQRRPRATGQEDIIKPLHPTCDRWRGCGRQRRVGLVAVEVFSCASAQRSDSSGDADSKTEPSSPAPPAVITHMLSVYRRVDMSDNRSRPRRHRWNIFVPTGGRKVTTAHRRAVKRSGRARRV
mgnify:CR=1 FL=1